jgi:hypothetical protein
MTWWSRLELFVRQYRVKRLGFGSGSWFVVEDGVGSLRKCCSRLGKVPQVVTPRLMPKLVTRFILQ